MRNLPDPAQLLSRKKIAEEKLLELKTSYNNFIDFWEKYKKEEKDLLTGLHKHLDRDKLATILKYIDSK